MIAYYERTTLRCRGPVEQEESEDVRGGILLVGDVVALAFEGPVSRAGSDSCSLRPAFHAGARAWLMTRVWCPGHGYSADGTEEMIVPFDEGVRLLVEHGRFAFPEPAGAAS